MINKMCKNEKNLYADNSTIQLLCIKPKRVGKEAAVITGIYESVNHARQSLAKVFVTSMEHSSFHWHYDYELMVLLKGELVVYTGPRPLQMHPGDICLINSKSVHGYLAGRDNNLCLFIQFPRTIFNANIPEKLDYHFYLNSVTNEYPLESGYEELVKTACKAGWHSRQNGLSHNYRTESHLYELFAHLLENVVYDMRRTPKSGPDKAVNRLITDISNCIDENCEKEQLIEGLCAQFLISEKTLYRYIKNELGVSVKELIDIARIERSKKLLRNSDLTILDIALRCGFESNATYYRVFKKVVGSTPKEYRDGSKGILADERIQGYLSYDNHEADVLLAKYSDLTQ